MIMNLLGLNNDTNISVGTSYILLNSEGDTQNRNISTVDGRTIKRNSGIIHL